MPFAGTPAGAGILLHGRECHLNENSSHYNRSDPGLNTPANPRLASFFKIGTPCKERLSGRADTPTPPRP